MEYLVSGVDNADLWTRRFHSAPDALLRLVCFPHAGGTAAFYVPFSRALTPNIDVVAIQYPCRQDRRSEPCLDSIAALAEAVAEQGAPPARITSGTVVELNTIDCASRLPGARS